MNIYIYIRWISVFRTQKKKEKKIKEEAIDIKMLFGSILQNNIRASFVH